MQTQQKQKVGKLTTETDRLSLAGEIRYYWTYSPGVDGRMYPTGCYDDMAAAQAHGGIILEEVAN